MRLDKWLWRARFYKTRGLACHAIKSGKITIKNERVKPSRLVKSGDTFKLRRGPYSFEIIIMNLAKSRTSASEAENLYKESTESITKREKIKLQFKALGGIYPRAKGRPSKRDRRKLIKFKTYSEPN